MNGSLYAAQRPSRAKKDARKTGTEHRMLINLSTVQQRYIDSSFLPQDTGSELHSLGIKEIKKSGQRQTRSNNIEHILLLQTVGAANQENYHSTNTILIISFTSFLIINFIIYINHK